MSDPLPKDYVPIPFPNFPDTPEGRRMYWQDTVLRRARIKDPDFHGGCQEAIQLIDHFREEKHPWWNWTTRTAVPGPWIEFRTFKEANAYVQTIKRLGK